MNRKKIIIVAIIILTLTILVIVFWVARSKGNQGQIVSPGGFFPESGSGNIKVIPPNLLGKNGLIGGQNLALTKLSLAPVSGAAYAEGQVIYVDRATGNMYKVNSDGSGRNRASNTTIPGIFESHFSAQGDNFILRYLSSDSGAESVRNFLAGFSGALSTTTAISIEGIFLPADISSSAISPEENKIFYTYKQGEYTIGITADFQNKKQKQVFSSPFGEWSVSWPSKNIITLLTKPSGTAEGFFYSLDAKTGKFAKIIGGINGLGAQIDKSGENVIYSEAGQNSLKASIYNLKKNEKNALPVSTFAEKCVFSYASVYVYCSVPINLPPALYPDEWYQGLVSFSDLIWKVNLSDMSTEILSGAENDFDATDSFLSSNEDYIFFTNKKDSSLWSLKLK